MNKPKKSNTQLKVRQRSRFQCEAEADGKLTNKQYAHIIPDSKGGPYTVDNILFLCYDCHHKYEPEALSGSEYEAMLERMRAIRDRPKIENLLSGMFDDFISGSGKPIKVRFGSDTFIDTQKIFTEQREGNVASFMSFTKKATEILINGVLKDERGKPFFTFTNSYIQVHSDDVWDIERTSRSLEMINRNTTVWFKLSQVGDIIYFTGNLFIGGGLVKIDKNKIEHGNIVTSNNTFESIDSGYRLDTPNPWRPVGHVNPSL